MDSVLAAAIGFVAALLTVSIQQRAQLKQQRQAAEDRRTEAATTRARRAAATCDRLFVELGKTVPMLRADPRRRLMEDEADRASSDREHAAEDEIETLLVDLPRAVQERVLAALEFIRNSDRMGSDDPRTLVHHYDRAATIARTTAQEMHRVLTAFLRNEAIPEPSARFREYEYAFATYTEEMEADFAEDIEQDRTAREAWLKERPELNGPLARRKSQKEGT